ncbi:MAG TPA: CPBP family intramembrane glutamic endopeptidase [Nocardia sp.]|uniref:CPBP family intramembrane metalloprotease n=1 Tax=Nocardia TaxID=1817 RepID=UPI002456EA37|nr:MULTISPECIES: CPBP family intramembrane metalloprotease [Nocardia]HLS79170.1 CPBP family intramembrane glutamic endopeptidase [Nocardia sp.]
MTGTVARPRLWPAITVWVLVWAICGLLAPVVQDAIGLSADVLALVMLAPAVAAVAVRITVRHRATGLWPAAPAPAVLLSTACALLWVAVFTACYAGTGADLDPSAVAVAGTPLPLLLLAQAVGALGEEIGWRGTLQRLGEAIAPRWVSAVVLGALFGATHLGYWADGAGFLTGFTLAVTAMSVAAVLLARGGFAQRMIPATVIHLGANLVIAAGGELTDAWRLVAPMLAATCVALLVDRFGARLFAVGVADTPAVPGLARPTREG